MDGTVPAFTHLHVHTEYSLLDGSSKIKEITARAKELGMDSLAITDHGVMYGVVDFYRAAKEAGIKPIIGCEVYVAPGSRFDRESGDNDERYNHLVLLAENQQGYQNLMKIVSIGFIDGFYYKPRVDYEVLETYHEGIIALSACLAGEVQRYLVRGMYEDAAQAAAHYERIFGKGNFFLELQDHGIDQQQMINPQLVRLSQESGIDLVATNDVHYTLESDAAAHDVLLCIQTNKKIQDEDRMRYEGGQFFLKSPQEMAALFPYAPQALENTHKIAERCNVEFEFGVTKLPRFDVPEGYTSREYLIHLCREGLVCRYGQEKAEDGAGDQKNAEGIREKDSQDALIATPGFDQISQSLRDRLDYELGTIEKMGYVDYFLIVWDFINYAKSHGIAVGPGRGSAAGSIVSYTLGITDIDPIRYSLLFERFLNPERVSMPDIDVDFCYERRQEVIDYVVRKYGKDRVVQIVTFGTMAARGVIRDVGRALDLPYSRCDSIAKMIPNELGITIDKALKQNHELKSLYDLDPEVKNLIDMCRRLEGLPRHTSMHAAGVVISQKAVDEYVPLSRGSDGAITTQFVMTTLEELGLLKMDFLGLRTLTVIQNAARFVKESKGIDLDMLHIDFNDSKVLESLGTGQTDGVFQLESAGMKSFMKELKPESLEDIIAGISLYRPGPMDFIPRYLKGKNDPASITYDCPELEPILEPTHGCIVYQEQVMQIVRDLGGFTLGRSDLLRRAMSKKKQKVMEEERQVFVYGNEQDGIEGCVKRGIPQETANRIYDEMIDFAKYAFNKSHAACYAVVSYQTAFLKYYYPVEFMAALMTSVIDNSSKVSEYILSCRKMNIQILPPDINEGQRDFSVFGNSIRYGLSAIKNIGGTLIDHIVEERQKNGRYKDLEDFLVRTQNMDLNKRGIENLIKAGAFDSIPGTRKQLMMVYASVLDRVNADKKNNLAGQMSLFDFVDEEQKASMQLKLPNVGEYQEDVKLSFEKEVLGFYVSGHPLLAYVDKIERNTSHSTADFELDSGGHTRVRDQESVTVGGMIAGITIKTTKNNDMMAFLTLEDLLGTVEVLVFPKAYETYRNLIRDDQRIFVKGKATVDENNGGKVIANQIYEFGQSPRQLWIRFTDMEQYQETSGSLMDLLEEHDGQEEVIFYLAREKQKKVLPKRQGVAISEELLERLYEMYQVDNVKVVEA